MPVEIVDCQAANPRSGRADRWFEREKSDKYYLRETCLRTGTDSILVLLWWANEQQLIDITDEEERRASRRSDWREED